MCFILNKRCINIFGWKISIIWNRNVFYNYVCVAYKIDMVARKTIVVTINAT